ncbi:MAG: CBS domain-containing protein [Chitinivibrionales bacterium]|nr:CBS domain-containing protein [Chitinivibrionales bacterium]
MKIRPIVQKIFSTVEAYTAVETVRAQLAQSSYVVVTEATRYIGLLSTNDVVRSPRNLIIDCLQDKPPVDVDDLIENVLQLMKRMGCNVLPVFEKQEFYGVVLQSDIVDYLLEYKAELEQEAARKSVIYSQQTTGSSSLQAHLQSNSTPDAAQQSSLGMTDRGIVHDLRNLVGGLHGYMEIIAGRCEHDTELEGYLDTGIKCAQRAHKLCKQLLCGTELIDSPASTRIGPIIQEAVHTFFTYSSIEVKLLIDEGLCPVKAKAENVHRILSNLLINAREAIEGSGQIIVAACNLPSPAHLPGRHRVEISISDSGCGISPEFLDRIFEPEFSTKQHGAGLGLVACKQMLEAIGGSIEVESGKEQGTAVTVRLPATEDDQAGAVL